MYEVGLLLTRRGVNEWLAPPGFPPERHTGFRVPETNGDLPYRICTQNSSRPVTLREYTRRVARPSPKPTAEIHALTGTEHNTPLLSLRKPRTRPAAPTGTPDQSPFRAVAMQRRRCASAPSTLRELACDEHGVRACRAPGGNWQAFLDFTAGHPRACMRLLAADGGRPHWQSAHRRSGLRGAVGDTPGVQHAAHRARKLHRPPAVAAPPNGSPRTRPRGRGSLARLPASPQQRQYLRQCGHRWESSLVRG